MAKMENHKYSVQEAFRECFYIVPDYQREYVWTDKEVNQLLEDINDEIDGASNSEYFIGTILVSPCEEKNHYEVIDGQQRLTTFFLLLCAIKNLFQSEAHSKLISDLITTSYSTSEGDVKTTLKLEPRYENAGDIMHTIVNVNGTPDMVQSAITNSGLKTFGSLENLVNAYNVIYRFLQMNCQDRETMKKFWGFLANNVVFIQISTDISNALKIFETINERGIGLNPMDLLKNLLFTQVKLSEFHKLKDEWKKITSPLEKSKEKPLRFLRYFLMANYKIENARNDATIREDEIYDWFIKKENAKLCGYKEQPFEFVRKIIRNVENYVAFSSGMGNDGQDNIYMNNLRKLCGGAFSLHFVLLLSACTLPKSLFDHFLKQLENFLFYYIFTKTPTKELERNFSIWADELRSICKLSDSNEQKKKLNEFIIEKFQKSQEIKSEELSDDLKRYNLNTLQQYRTRYLLAKLTQYVDMAYKGLSVAGSLEDYTGLEIEHILPNNPTDELKQDFVKNDKDKKYDEYKIKLGNLTLLEKPLNIVAGRKYFDSKIEEYKKCKYYLTSSIAEKNIVGINSSINRINEKLISFSEWNAESIDKRQEMLIALAKKIWEIKGVEVE